MTLPVVVEEWQFACCGDPFAVGDLVRWQLSFSADDHSVPDALVAVDVVAGDRVASEASGRDGMLLTVEGGPLAGVTVFGAALPGAGPIPLTGRFAEDHHGLVPEAVPLTVGRITRVREAQVEHARHGGDALVADPSTWVLRDVRGFADGAGSRLFLVDLQLVR